MKNNTISLLLKGRTCSVYRKCNCSLNNQVKVRSLLSPQKLGKRKVFTVKTVVQIHLFPPKTGKIAKWLRHKSIKLAQKQNTFKLFP